MRWLADHLIGLGQVLFGSALLTILGMTGLHFAFGSPIKFVGLGFLLFGLAMIIPNSLAARYWQRCSATILTVEGDDPPTLHYEYSFSGRKYSGKLSETSSKKLGDFILIFVDPNDPSSHIPHTFVGRIIGIIFVLAGMVAIASNDANWYPA